MANVKDAEASQTIDIRAPGYVAVRVRSGIRPFDDGTRAARVGGFAIFEKPRVDVIPERLDGFARDPCGFSLRDVALFDQI